MRTKKETPKLSNVEFMRLGLSETEVYNDLYILEMYKQALINPLMNDQEKLSYIEDITDLYQEVFERRYVKHTERYI